ncbi:MAG TPA: urease accessory protein UreF [Casimicrobiaceae bacterium]|nr:urease accessory protein UreF [Casimicrobiaceae bacterium]
MTEDALSLVRLLQLASPALPVGAYSYSQGLEWMIESRTIHDAATVQQWIGDVLEHVMAVGEAAVLWRLLDATTNGDAACFREWNAWYRAARESRELRAETEQMGGSLVQLVTELGALDDGARALAREAAPITFPAAFALSACGLKIRAGDALTGYLMSWLENQVLVAVKALPLGQVAGQRLLHVLSARIPAVAARARTLADDDVASFAPGLALASARHETQYSRLFRS